MGSVDTANLHKTTHTSIQNSHLLVDMRAEEMIVKSPTDPRQLFTDLHARVVDVDPVPPALFVLVGRLKVN